MIKSNLLKKTILALGVLPLFSACSSSNNQDLVDFMETTRTEAANRSRIEALPAYPPYVASIYSAAGLRSPFEPPRQAVATEIRGVRAAAPDLARPKEFLERFSITELTMVGTIEKDGVRWALIMDSSASVHRVREGNYLGRNYGKILDVGEGGLEMVEVVVNGQGGWIERPRTLNMNN